MYSKYFCILVLILRENRTDDRYEVLTKALL